MVSLEELEVEGHVEDVNLLDLLSRDATPTGISFKLDNLMNTRHQMLIIYSNTVYFSRSYD